MKAFLRANWLALIMAAPIGLGVSCLFAALAALNTPAPSRDLIEAMHALKAYETATSNGQGSVGLVAFFAVIAFVIWRWRTTQRLVTRAGTSSALNTPAVPASVSTSTTLPRQPQRSAGA